MAKPKQILAKLTAPTAPRVVERKRLIRLLDGAITSPLTWLTAPPGAGKTTLLASYLQHRAERVVWYRMDAGDTDPSTWFHYLGVAVRAAAPRARARLPHLTPEYLAGLSIFTQRFFEQLCRRFRQPLVIVFDNYQEVPPESVIHQLLPIGIQQVPSHMRLVVLSREPPPAPYARLQADQHITMIEASELALTREEARQLSQLHKQAAQSPVGSDESGQLWELTKGWMAGFILLLKQQGAGSLTDLSMHRSPQALFAYLAGEVMVRFPSDMQTVLLTLSILSDLTPQIARQLSGVETAGVLLEQLYQSRYFIERREDRLGWYRFHPLFQEFLVQRAEQVWSRAKLDELRRQAAALLVEARLEEDALQLWEQAQAWDEYRALVRAQAPVLAQQGRMQTLDAWIRQLPDAERDRDPWMDFWLAQGRLLVSPQEASSLYESAMRRFQQRGERAGVLLAWAGAVQAILVAWSGMKHIHELVRFFEEFHPEGTAYPSAEIEAVVAQAMAGAYMQMYTDRPQARVWLDRSVELSHALPVSMRASEMVNNSIFYVQLGEGDTAQRVFAQQKQAWGPGASASMQVMMAFSESMLAWWSGDIESCRNAVQRALDHAEQEGLVTWNWLLYSQAIYNELLFGNTRAARSYLDLMEPFSAFCACRLNALVLGGWADLIDGQIDQTWRKCRQGRDIMEIEGGPTLHVGFLGILEAKVLATRGQRADAAQRLEMVEAIAQAIPWFFLFGVFFLRAQWAFQDGNEVQGKVWLQRLLDEGKKNQQISSIGWIPQEASRLFAKALELEMEVPYVLEAIRKWQLKPPTDGSVPETWPWRVKIRTFGKLAVEVDGKPLKKQRKAPHRLLELLAAIITFGGQEVLVSRLIDALWPEADGDTGHENFKKAIARLRKLLGVDDVIKWQDGKVSLNRDLCWVDVLAFERQATQHDSRAMALYTGPFLGHEQIPVWAESRRDHERTTFIRLVNRHYDDVQTAGNVDEAIRSLERAIDADPVAEPFYQRLIPVLVAHGRQADAVAQLERCRSALARWLDRPPSPELQALLNNITSK